MKMEVGLPVIWIKGEECKGIIHSTTESTFTVKWDIGRIMTYTKIPVSIYTGKPQIVVDVEKLREDKINSILQ